jgi:Flp pilus assembly protein TadD
VLLQPGDLSVKDEPLDLGRHALEDIPGKSVVINGVAYRILGRSRVTPAASVYPLLNKRTLLVGLELKVFLCRPGSDDYNATKTRGLRTFREKAMVSSGADPAADFFIIEEIYEQNGGMLGLQRCFGGNPGPNYYPEQMSKALALVRQERPADAMQEFDRILALNPGHIAALGNKGVCLARQGDIPGALQLFLRGIELYANETAAYRNAAMFSAAYGRPEPALGILKKTLSRYAGDFGSWMTLVRIATEHDALDEVDDVVAAGLALVGDTKLGQKLRPVVDESRARWERYSTALEQAASAQLSRAWDNAIPILERAETMSKRNAVAEMNRAVCLFHKGRIHASVELLCRCAHRLYGEHAHAANLLLLLGFAELGEWDRAGSIALDLHKRFEQPLGLPRIPVLVRYPKDRGPASGVGLANCVEDPGTDRIVATLSRIQAHTPRTVASATAFEQLRERYLQLAAVNLPPLPESTSGLVS